MKLHDVQRFSRITKPLTEFHLCTFDYDMHDERMQFDMKTALKDMNLISLVMKSLMSVGIDRWMDQDAIEKVEEKQNHKVPQDTGDNGYDKSREESHFLE